MLRLFKNIYSTIYFYICLFERQGDGEEGDFHPLVHSPVATAAESAQATAAVLPGDSHTWAAGSQTLHPQLLFQEHWQGNDSTEQPGLKLICFFS